MLHAQIHIILFSLSLSISLSLSLSLSLSHTHTHTHTHTHRHTQTHTDSHRLTQNHTQTHTRMHVCIPGGSRWGPRRGRLVDCCSWGWAGPPRRRTKAHGLRGRSRRGVGRRPWRTPTPARCGQHAFIECVNIGRWSAGRRCASACLRDADEAANIKITRDRSNILHCLHHPAGPRLCRIVYVTCATHTRRPSASRAVVGYGPLVTRPTPAPSPRSVWEWPPTMASTPRSCAASARSAS